MCYCSPFDSRYNETVKELLTNKNLEGFREVVIVDDLIFSGYMLMERIERLKTMADIVEKAIVVITDFRTMNEYLQELLQKKTFALKHSALA